MSYWQGILNLTSREIKNARWKNLIILAIVIYMVIFTESLYEGLVGRIGETDEIGWILDYIVIMIFGSVGLINTHLYSNKKDMLAERLSYWRTLPIGIKQIVWSRVISVSVSLIATLLIYYAALTYILNQQIIFEPVQFFIHALAVLAVCLILNMFFLYCELCLTVKIYTRYCWLLLLIVGLITVAYYFWLDWSLIRILYELSIQQSFLTAAASLIIIALTIATSVKVIDKKLRKRSILK